MYDRLCSGLCNSQLTIPELLKVAPAGLVQEEIDRLKVARGTMTGMTKFEGENANAYMQELDKRGVPEELQAFAVNQNPKSCFKAASKAGVLPLITASDKHIWLRARGGPLLALEKFAGHGYPVTPALADALRIPVAQFESGVNVPVFAYFALFVCSLYMICSWVWTWLGGTTPMTCGFSAGIRFELAHKSSYGSG